MKNVTLNDTQRLFVLKHSGGYTHFGYDNAFKHLAQFSQLLGRPAPDASEIGTLAQYEQYLEAQDAYCKTKPTGMHFDPETAEGVKSVLTRLWNSRERVRIWLGDAATGKSWLEESYVKGTIGRSTGALKVPLLIFNSRSMGGDAILTACVLRIVGIENRCTYYQHPKFTLPEFALQPSTQPGKSTAVLADGVVHADFHSEAKALNWISFMRGNRMSA